MRSGFALILLGSLTSGVLADDISPRPLTAWERQCRAGCPKEQAWWARPGVECRDHGYYAGGGSPYYRRADVRRCDEGTFGWDYRLRFTRVKLLWTHGRCRQAGDGQYEPDQKNNPLDDTLDP